MEQWTERTSLRLLELIASTTLAVAGDLDAGALPDRTLGHATLGDSAVVDVLASLAESDSHFEHWLRVAAQQSSFASTERSSAAEIDWPLVAGHWLAWLAAEQALNVLPASDSSSGEERDTAYERSALYRRVLVATAQAALRSRALRVEREAMREQLARELAYDMAYGLSHELNNPLANIAARARLLAEDEASEHKRQLLAAVVDQAMRGCEMIADLMLIARPPVLDAQPVALASIVGEVVARARPWAEARGLNLVVHMPDQTACVATDRAAMSEALWALLRNALEVAQNQITVAVASNPAFSGRISSPADQSAAVAVSIQDDGPGISPQARAHAFNPYFSGREAGRGLGVGLAKADRLARLSGGSVTIDSVPDGGCIATLHLPLCSE